MRESVPFLPRDPAQAAYVAGLRLIATRDLSEAQMRDRLARRSFLPEAIESAVARLRHERVLDDRRVALASARCEARVKRHGAHRALRQLQAIGIDRELAREAVREVFAQIDESALLEEAISRRLRGRRVRDSAESRRLYAHFVHQGFPPAAVSRALKARGGAAIETDNSV